MCAFKELGLSWPPRGWEQLRYVENSTGQAIAKDPVMACVTGLTYNIEPLPFYKASHLRGPVYFVDISGWEYTIHNESREYSVLSFFLQERPDRSAPKEFYISDLKTMGQIVRVTERSAKRAVTAVNFLIKQINGGKVPDTDRILMLYKIHPAQRSLYDIDNSRPDSLYCGLPYADNDLEKSDSA